MAIVAYTGLPGSGKSYGVVANQVLPGLKAGRRIVTNLPLILDELEAVVPGARDLVTDFNLETIQADPDRITEFATPGSILIIDEVSRLWPTGEKANKVPQAYRVLLAEHRHMVDAQGNSMQIVLVCQDLSQLSKFARDLVANTYMHTKLSHMGADKSYRLDIYQGAQTGLAPPERFKLRSVYGKYDMAVCKLYKSHTRSQAEGLGADEKPVDTRHVIWKRPMIWVGLGFIVVCLVWGIPAVKNAFKTGGVDANKARSPGATSLVGNAKAGMATALDPGSPLQGDRQASSPSPNPSSGWRVAGYMQRNDGSGMATLTNGRYFVTVDLNRYCLMDLDLGPSCAWEGGRVTMYSDQRFPSPTNTRTAIAFLTPGVAVPGERSDPGTALPLVEVEPVL